jgi:hypothetical protein
MTKISKSKIVIRETDVYERTAPLIVALHPRHLTLRLKGHHEALNVDYGAILDLGRKLAYRRKAS